MEDVQGRRVCREMSSEMAKVRVQPRTTKPTFKKVQIVYYLSRNGHLEHPHYVEVTHLAHQQPRLKDFMDRLTVLRGRGMPSLYSWSCKRSYKNGYVWNDLAETDVIHSSEGDEYVLKGSELMEGCTDKLHHLQVGNVQLMKSQQAGQDSNFQLKRKSLASKRWKEAEEIVNDEYDHHGEDEENMEEVEEYEEKTSYMKSTAPQSRCSRGVSTEEIEEFKQPKNDGQSEMSLDSNTFSSPPSTTSSSVSEKANNDATCNTNNSTCKRFEDGDPVRNEPLMSRNSVLLSFIACGGSASFRKIVPPPVVKQSSESLLPSTAARKSGSGGYLHKGAVCKTAEQVAVDENEMIIGSISENPRFRNLQTEEKEYFSGSIVESIAAERIEVAPGLKKSSSHNEEMSTMAGLGEGETVEELQREGRMRGKCIPSPRKRSSTKSKK